MWERRNSLRHSKQAVKFTSKPPTIHSVSSLSQSMMMLKIFYVPNRVNWCNVPPSPPSTSPPQLQTPPQLETNISQPTNNSLTKVTFMWIKSSSWEIIPSFPSLPRFRWCWLCCWAAFRGFTLCALQKSISPCKCTLTLTLQILIL